jgi:hypothetical protein
LTAVTSTLSEVVFSVNGVGLGLAGRRVLLLPTDPPPLFPDVLPFVTTPEVVFLDALLAAPDLPRSLSTVPLLPTLALLLFTFLMSFPGLPGETELLTMCDALAFPLLLDSIRGVMLKHPPTQSGLLFFS